MNCSKKIITLDIQRSLSQADVSVMKNDNARTLKFVLSDGGEPYVISEGCTAIFRARKPDGTVLYNNCVIMDNMILYEMTDQTTASVGVVECEVQLVGGDGKTITSPRFTLCVSDTLYDDGQIESEDEFTALQTAIAGANNLNVSVSKSGGTSTISVTKKDGTIVSASVVDGQDGAKGDRGEKGEKGDTGDKGDTGNGIVSVVKTGTGASVDTYTITFTDGTTTTFDVTNGSVTSVNGKTGAVSLTESDVKPNFTLIETITLEEDTDLISRTGYNYTDMIFRFKMPASSRSTETGQFNFGSDVVAWLPMLYRAAGVTLVNYRVKCEGGLMCCEYGASLSTTPQNLSDIPSRHPAGWLGAFALSKITHFQFGIYSTTIPAGTEIKIYAR